MTRSVLGLLLLYSSSGVAQEQKLVADAFQKLEKMLGGLAAQKTPDTAKAYAARITLQFSGYCVVSRDPVVAVQNRTRALDRDAAEVLTKMVESWKPCPAPAIEAPDEPVQPDSRLRLDLGNAVWSKLGVNDIEFLCLAVKGDQILAGSVHGIYYLMKRGVPWDIPRDAPSEGQRIEAVALTDHEAFAGGVTTGLPSPLYAAPLGSPKLRWHSANLLQSEAKALAFTDDRLFISTEKGVFTLAAPYFQGDPGEERLSRSSERDELSFSYDFPFLATVAQIGPVGAARTRSYVVPYRRSSRGWHEFSDNHLGEHAVITALASDGPRAFAGTADGEVFGRCPTSAGDESWTKFENSPFPRNIKAIAVGGGRIYISNGLWVYSSADDNCEKSSPPGTRKWVPMTGKELTRIAHVNALAYSGGVLFAATGNDIWSLSVIPKSAPAKTQPAKAPVKP
jgi:hypothetical protein